MEMIFYVGNYVQGNIYGAEGKWYHYPWFVKENSIDGGTGTDSILLLNNYTSNSWSNNVDNIQSRVSNFENIKLRRWHSY